MKQKTAMMELIEEAKKSPIMFNSTLWLIEHLNLLEKEKKQIIDTALVMYHSGMNKHQLTPEEYYNKIYLNESKQ